MIKHKPFLLILGLPFAALTAYSIYDVGLIGIFQHLLDGSAGWQVFADLVIALVLVMSWMINDARKIGRNVWPYIAATFLLGSFGPLAYLLTQKSN
ncbi:MAG: DUF2834 domain-containing protein [Woeseiaceae bacterium]